MIQQPMFSLQISSVIVHHGNNVHQGHYTCYVCKENVWFKCNDSEVTKVKLEDALCHIQDAYILL